MCGMAPEELRQRTRRFAVGVIRFCRTLPRTDEAKIVGRQLLRSGTGVGSNYRAACRPRSDADFIAKLGTAIEEADETAFWLEVLVEAATVRERATESLYRECDELIRILVASRETARRNSRAKKAAARTRKP
jgi:four helix bundle protein